MLSPTFTPLVRAAAVTLLLAHLALPLAAQKKNESYQYHIHRARSPIAVDGLIDEPAWRNADVASDFWMVLPMDTDRAKVRTEVRMTYDDRNIYLSAVCHHGSVPGPYMVESLRRDWSFGNNDNFIFFLDTFDDQTNGFTFGLNAAGAQWDGLLYEGSRANLSWDQPWTSSLKSFPDRYQFEIAIPFKSIRYKAGIRRWGVNFSRLDLKTTEKSSWTPIGRHFPTAALALAGVLLWDEAPPEPGLNMSVIPYALGGLSHDNQTSPVRTSSHGDVGLDAKIGLGPALNLDLTVNPDFSQVEVDQQVTNLDRFELFFPERRQFFLENGDLFTNFGYSTIRPFFSRRIGLGGVPIRAGARLSGKLNKDWRIGIMDMQTGAVPREDLPGQNFAVLALQRRVFARSNVSFLYVDKQDIDRPDSSRRYNRNLGIEYNLATVNNLWTGKLLYLKSFTSNRAKGDVLAGHLQYNSRRWLILGQMENVQSDFNAEVGYVPRNGYHRALTTIGYTFLPAKGPVLSHGPQFQSSSFFDNDWSHTDSETYVSYNATLRNQDVLGVWGANDSVRLLQPFDPTNTGREKIAAGTSHNWRSWGTKFDSRPQSVFRYGFSSRYGGYYERGTRLNLTANAGYRFQPYAAISGAVNYNRINLRAPWNSTTFWLIGPRFDLTFTSNLYLTTFIQYNEQQSNMNVNSRLQWRYKPASDLFLVYTDNYLPTHLQPGQDLPGLFTSKNRALVLKWTYWWNL